MDANAKMLETIESIGPQLFAIKGSHSIWTSIIQTFDQKLINCLLEIIQEMDSKQKFHFAKRLLIEGKDQVINEYIQSHNNSIKSDESQELVINEDMIDGSDEDDSVEYNFMLSLSDGYLEPSGLESDTDVLSDASESQLLSETSNRSYKTALYSPQIQSQRVYSELSLGSNKVDINERQCSQSIYQLNDNSNQMLSQSPPLLTNQVSSEDMPSSGELSGRIVSLSPISSYYSQRALSVSSSGSSQTLSSIDSQKSSIFSQRSGRSGRKSSTKSSSSVRTESNKSRVTFDWFCS